MSKKKIAIVVPFFNEEDNLIFFIREWEKFITKKKKINEILFFYFINDGSTDNSIKEIKNNIKKLNFKILNKKNTGHGDSCKFAYNYVAKNKNNFDYLLQIDSDNQCDPIYLSKFLNTLKSKKYNFIFGFRKTRQDGYIRILISRILSFTLYVKKLLYIKDMNTPYRLMRIKDLKKILLIINKKKKYKCIKLFNCVLSYEISKKYYINWININFRERKFGKSKFNFHNMLRMYFNFLLKV
jgi:dolichol-phosphate mannosyltransferase